MKKLLKTFFLFGCAFSLFGCNQGVPPTEDTSQLDSKGFADDTLALIEDNLHYAIPYYEADSVEAVVVPASMTNLDVDSVWVTFSPVDYGVAVANYHASCLEDGFEEIEGALACVKEINAAEDLYLQYHVDREAFALVVVGYVVQARFDVFPEDQVRAVIGCELPMIEAYSYKFDSSYAGVTSGGEVTYVPTIVGWADYRDGGSPSEAYATLLEINGFLISEEYQMHMAYRAEDGCKVYFEDEEETTLYFQAFNADPWLYGLFVLQEAMGLPLPRLKQEGSEGFYNEVSSKFCLHLVEVDLNFASIYAEAMVQAGFQLESNNELSETTDFDKTYSFRSDAGLVSVRVLHSSIYNELVLVI